MGVENKATGDSKLNDSTRVLLKIWSRQKKFQVAGSNLFPCWADPKKCRYIFPEWPVVHLK